MDVPHDIAISFLSGDEPLAVRIHDELTEKLSVFVYSKRQEQLAGTDGLESFRKAFLSDARLVVVLYRDGWGKTRWTAVEELAIKDRIFDGGWNSLLFVMLDEKATPPAWLPKTHIRFNYGSYGDDLIGAIKMRAQGLGSSLKVETATERAKRAQSIELLRAERDRMLLANGSAAVRAEHQALRVQLDRKISDIQKELTTIRLEYGADSHEYVIRTEAISLNFYLHATAPATQSRIVIQRFDAPLILPSDRSRRMFLPGESPRMISKEEFFFDYDTACGWCWRKRERGSQETLLSTVSLAEYLLKCVFDIHEQLKAGKIARRRGSDDL
jgi:hypothetical protein